MTNRCEHVVEVGSVGSTCKWVFLFCFEIYTLRIVGESCEQVVKWRGSVCNNLFVYLSLDQYTLHICLGGLFWKSKQVYMGSWKKTSWPSQLPEGFEKRLKTWSLYRKTKPTVFAHFVMCVNKVTSKRTFNTERLILEHQGCWYKCQQPASHFLRVTFEWFIWKRNLQILTKFHAPAPNSTLHFLPSFLRSSRPHYPMTCVGILARRDNYQIIYDVASQYL
jgi:hypothetical protein